MPPAAPSPIMTVPDVAAYLNVSRSTVYRMVRDGQLPFFRVSIGGDLRFNREAIDKWIAERERAK